MSDPLSDLADKDAIVDLIVRLFIGTDNRDWAAVESCFAPTVHFDMSSVGAGPAVDRSPRQIIAAWEEGLRPLEAVHHQAGNHRVTIEGDRATAFCYGVAFHYRRTHSGRNTRTFVGSYDFGLQRSTSVWRIDSFRFNLKFLDGNLELEKEPAA